MKPPSPVPEPIALPAGGHDELLVMHEGRALHPPGGLRALRGFAWLDGGPWTSAAQASDGHWGLLAVDAAGCHWRVSPQWENAGSPSEGLMRVRRGGRWGCVDVQGRIRIEPRYEALRGFSTGRAAAQVGEAEWCWVDARGRRVGAGTFGRLYGLDAQGFARATLRSNDGPPVAGFVDRDGAWIVPPRFRHLLAFGPDGVAPASEDGERWGLIDRRGAWVLEPCHRRIAAFNADGLAHFCPRGSLFDIRYGYLDARGRVRVAPESYVSEHMACGVAAADYDGSRYVRADGTPLPAPALSFGSPFRAGGGYALARTGQEPAAWGLLRGDGRFLPVPGDLLEPLTDGEASIPDPPPGGACAPFLTRDGGVAWLHPERGVLWRARYGRSGVLLSDADGRALWRSEACREAPRPFFSQPAESFLQNLREPEEVAALAEVLLARTVQRLHDYAAGRTLARDDDADDGSEDDEEGDDDDDVQQARIPVRRRLFRAYLSDELIGPYAFLGYRYGEHAQRMNEALSAVLSARFGAVHATQTEVSVPGGYPPAYPPAWRVARAQASCWLALYARNGSGDGDAWWELWLQAGPAADVSSGVAEARRTTRPA